MCIVWSLAGNRYTFYASVSRSTSITKSPLRLDFPMKHSSYDVVSSNQWLLYSWLVSICNCNAFGVPNRLNDVDALSLLLFYSPCNHWIGWWVVWPVRFTVTFFLILDIDWILPWKMKPNLFSNLQLTCDICMKWIQRIAVCQWILNQYFDIQHASFYSFYYPFTWFDM